MSQSTPNYEQIMQSFFHHSLDTISIIGIDGVFRYVNPAFESLYGIPAESVLGQSVWTLWIEKQADFHYMSKSVLAGESVSEYETERIGANGRRIHVSLTISPILDMSGSVEGYLTVGRDITEKKQMEQRLREVDRRFRLIEENISDLVAVAMPSGVIEYASKSHESLFGVSVADVVGKTLTRWIHPADVNRAVQAFEQIFTDKKRSQIECRAHHANGTWLDTEIVLTPIFEDNGDIGKIMFVSRDIADRRNTERLLLQAEKFSVVGQLGAALAHEIRNPLTSIKGFIQLLEQNFNNSEYLQDEKSYFKIIFSELSRIENIIEEFLSSAKPQVNNLRRCEMAEILSQCISVMQPEAHMYNIDIQHDLQGENSIVWGDPGKLKQVFVNLLKNAIESMSEGGIILVTSQRLSKTRMRVQIVDQGCGIPVHLLPKLGSPFYTTKEKGTGLGLTVSSKIIHEHKGNMDFVSKPGEGTTVQIDLPTVL